MTTMTLESNERVWDDILDLENSNRSGGHKKSFTKDDKTDENVTHHYSAGLPQRGDTAESSLKESSRPRKKDRRRNRDGTDDSRRSATRESRGERARSLSRGLGRSLSKLRSRSKSALRNTASDKSKRKSITRIRSDVNEQHQSPDPVGSHSADAQRNYPAPDRSTSDDNTIENDNDSFGSDTLEHDRGKELVELFERQHEELQLVMSTSIAKFDEEAKYWKKKAKALKKKYEGETNASSVGREKELRALSSTVSELEYKLKDNEKKSGEKIENLENLLKALGEEKEELKRKVNSSSQQAFALGQQVKDRDSSIAQLRHVMEKAEEDSESRIELLERQLDKLVEMKSRRPDNSTSQTISSASTTTSAMSQALTASQVSYTSNSHTENSHESGDNDNSLEVKNLEALLVRILAEKDKLAFENENLRALVAQNETSCKPVALANLRTYQLSCRNCIDQSFVGQTRDNVKQKVRDHFSEGKVLWQFITLSLFALFLMTHI